MGPSTPLSKTLFEYGADVIAGVITDDPRVLDVVSQGGGRKELGGYLELVCMEK
ncbi:MAG: Rossmann-like domain-containing protein [Candidatus Alkanophagales archaeon]